MNICSHLTEKGNLTGFRNFSLDRRRLYGRGKRKNLFKEGEGLNEREPLLAETALRAVRHHGGGVQPVHDERPPPQDGDTREHREHPPHDERLPDRQRRQLWVRAAGGAPCLKQGQPEPEPEEKAGGNPDGRVQDCSGLKDCKRIAV